MTKIQNFLIKTALARRLFFTFFCLSILRAGMILPLPGIDNESLLSFISNEKTFFSFLNSLSGGSFSSIGPFALNIFPAINASILFEFLVPIFPYLDKLRKEEGEAGEKRLSFYRRILTFVLAIFQSVGIISFLRPFIFDWNFFSITLIGLSLTAGAMTVLWLSEIITEKGIANGSSLIIFTNILVNNQKFSIINQLFKNNSNFNTIISISIIFIILVLILYTQECVREIPIISAQQLTGEAMPYISKRGSNIPLKLNQSGIFPIIFASTVFFLPSYFGKVELPEIISKYIIPVIYYFLIVFLSYLYSSFAWDPKRISDDLKKVSFSIPGVRPGLQTEKYLENILIRISLLGGLILSLIVSLPQLVQFFLEMNYQPFNISSLIILIGVSLEIQKNFKSLILSNLIISSKGD